MKKIEIYMRPEKLDATCIALKEIGIVGMTITEVKGLGEQKGHTEIYRGAEYQADFIPKIRVDMVVANEEVDRCVQVITSQARTGEVGDGKIIIVPIEEMITIRTGQVIKSSSR